MNPPQPSCIRLPAETLASLGRWRDRDDLRVILQANQLWVFYPSDDEPIHRHLLALPHADPAMQRDNLWYRPGCRMPLLDVPDATAAVRLDHILFPEPVSRAIPPARPTTSQPIHLRRDSVPRRTTALLVGLATLAVWADTATTDDISAVEGATSGDEALLRGRLPALPGRRFWGRRVLVETGWVPDPNLSEEVLAQVLHLRDECALFTPDGVETIPENSFTILTRSSIRLATRNRARGGV